MRIIVCMKQVFDPEMPYSLFKIDPGEKRVVPPQGTPPVLSPFDENALEAALRLKDEHEAKVIVISMGSKLSRPVLRRPLAAGADELILLDDQAFEDLDSFASARVLAAAIRRIGDFDMVFTGRQAADSDAGIAGCCIAEELDAPCITLAKKVEIQGGHVRAERVVTDGFEVLEASLPCVVTVDSDLGELRQISMPSLLAAQKKPVEVWQLAELELDSVPSPRCELVDLYTPQHQTVCEIIDGETPEDAATKLVHRLHEKRLLGARSGTND